MIVHGKASGDRGKRLGDRGAAQTTTAGFRRSRRNRDFRSEFDDLAAKLVTAVLGLAVAQTNTVHASKAAGWRDRSNLPGEDRGFREVRAEVLRRFEVEYVTSMLRDAGSVSEAARRAKIDRKHFWRMMQRNGLLRR